MAIQLRRGQKADFDGTKLLPGECAVCLDTDQMYYKTSNGAVELQNKADIKQWTPELWDLDTKVYTFPENTGNYMEIGDLGVFFLNYQLTEAATFSTMLQIGGFPENVLILGGTVYSGGAASSLGDRTIQAANNKVYIRPNYTGTLAANTWFSFVVFGILT